MKPIVVAAFSPGKKLRGVLAPWQAGQAGALARARPVRQHGAVLMLVLVFLVVMLLGALTMIRATDSATLVAANLGYKQSGLASADLAVESAIAWIGAQDSSVLQSNSTTNGYLATYDPEGPDIKNGQTWAEYWDDTSKLPTGYKCWISWSGSPAVATCNTSSNGQSVDAAGNREAYLIQRMCTATGSPTSATTGCALSASATSADENTMGAGVVSITSTSQVYYRITVRVDGPRDTVTYTQAMIVL